jgi:outer membrane receptor protein involved in Fe transport
MIETYPRRLSACAVTVCVMCSATAARAQSEVVAGVEETSTAALSLEELDPAADYTVKVTGRRPVTAASSKTVRARDFLLRPHARPADILSVTPGLYVVQHSGGGKANQYFMRGFDLDHGTDLAISVDGVPVNLVSHGHGQGYADLHFLIPELVEKIEVFKGTYFAELGDLATAGAVNLVTKSSVAESSVSLGGGSFGTLRSLLVLGDEFEGWKPLVAAELYHTDGPFNRAEDLNRMNLFGKISRELEGGGRLSLALSSYAGGWNASGQVPLREVLAGRLDRFGSIDPSEGGSSRRYSAHASYQQSGDRDQLSLSAYLNHYRWRLYSNFTFFSVDPVNGDMIEQTDVRTLGGGQAKYSFTAKLDEISLRTTIGAQLRNDDLDNGLYRDRARERLRTLIDAGVAELSIGAFVEEDATWTPWLRTVTGVRADYFGFAVTDRRAELSIDERSSGARSAAIVSPKASVILSPLEETELYLNFGLGFHSNDARGVVRTIDPVSPLTRAIGAELGFRTQLFERLDLAGSAFLLDLESEIVWVGDEGTTEARGPTRRIGLEGEVRLEVLSWLFADLDATVSKGTFVESPSDVSALALAPRITVSSGLSARHESGVYGRLSVFHIADRPATEDRFLTAEGFTRVDATVGYRHRSFEISVAAQNLLDSTWREAQFANVSRLPSESASASCPSGTRPIGDGRSFAGCEDIHFTSGAPIGVQANAIVYF